MATFKIKICGMRDPDNIRQVADLSPDYMGLIFYRRSPRYVTPDLADNILASMAGTQKTGVFVNEPFSSLSETIKRFNLQLVQLHANESPEYCRQARKLGAKVIKAFGINESFDFSILKSYLDTVDFFLFDTATPMHGGSGQTFDWSALSAYPFSIPYFLSGGIGPGSVDELLALKDPRLHAIDINSRFEIGPALKNVETLRLFIETIKNQHT